MEDAHQLLGVVPGLPDHAFVAVYDGHGGSVAAEIAGQQMLAYIQQQPEYGEYVASTGAAGAIEKLGQAMEAAFLAFDRELPPKLQERGDTSGCTAVAAMITPTHIVCANAGDSRGCYCSGTEVVALSDDHKPANITEKQRILAAGGSVSGNRVDGRLAVSRALGDFIYKNRLDLPPEQQKVGSAIRHAVLFSASLLDWSTSSIAFIVFRSARSRILGCSLAVQTTRFSFLLVMVSAHSCGRADLCAWWAVSSTIRCHFSSAAISPLVYWRRHMGRDEQC
jgi:serine/threonine protein phosphatase PrpC|eukprot:COSAG01_NODE_4204_length_5243_cov_1005.231532_2_plen_280_part_00